MMVRGQGGLDLTWPTCALKPWHICCHTWASHRRDTYSLNDDFSHDLWVRLAQIPEEPSGSKEPGQFSPVTFLLEKLSTSEADWGRIKHGCPAERPLLQRKNIIVCLTWICWHGVIRIHLRIRMHIRIGICIRLHWWHDMSFSAVGVTSMTTSPTARSLLATTSLPNSSSRAISKTLIGALLIVLSF